METEDTEQIHLTELDDDRLAELAHEWRARALRGEQAAYGPAQAYEAELRRRIRNSGFHSPAPAVSLPDKPWWRFW